jgi:NADH-quinone oxidoreductase subunit E
MLSDREREAILRELTGVPSGSAACAEALGIVQRERGWVSDEAVRDLSDILGLTPEEIDGIATFYDRIYRRPVGAHVILLCDGVSCWVMGCEGIRAHIEERLEVRLGETTGDGMFTFLPAGCLGACDVAPAMMVDGELYGNLNDDKVDEILLRYREKGAR